MSSLGKVAGHSYAPGQEPTVVEAIFADATSLFMFSAFVLVALIVVVALVRFLFSLLFRPKRRDEFGDTIHDRRAAREAYEEMLRKQAGQRNLRNPT